MSDVKVAVVYYSATGSVHRLAEAIALGAADTGAEVRLRRVAELAPDHAIDANPAWRTHIEAVNPTIPEATLDDLEWANAYAFGTPTRFGNTTAQLKQFLDTSGGLWLAGKLADKPVTSFTSAINAHGGMESTILSLNNVFYHWGCIIVGPGYTDDSVYAAGGNPYGTSWASGTQGNKPDAAATAAARYQGRRLAIIAARLLG
ncbi:NAD(P)H:quinone oxidoreductase [Catellatospora tritici]|uniref:NAD(P)H:quinone oxidoreductase n=1 Tax=Catellatospora tritici TaxID=2851566 RepID=UPI001C2D2B26|nr:NAD(P)H:quinone oxidoreductase [Catellatospora tritici]MBV1854383.1 NAD(P)H:quinone oxidoreductase [Catellatospora tritici]